MESARSTIASWAVAQDAMVERLSSTNFAALVEREIEFRCEGTVRSV
jgi:hypothetical protein